MPEYIEICKRSTEANEYLTTRYSNSVKEHSNGDDNAAIKDVKDAAKRFNKYFEALEQDVTTLKVARDELNKKLALRRENAFKAMFTISVGSIGLVLAAWTYLYLN